jgi:hypothetical protein
VWSRRDPNWDQMPVTAKFSEEFYAKFLIALLRFWGG